MKFVAGKNSALLKFAKQTLRLNFIVSDAHNSLCFTTCKPPRWHGKQKACWLVCPVFKACPQTVIGRIVFPSCTSLFLKKQSQRSAELIHISTSHIAQQPMMFTSLNCGERYQTCEILNRMLRLYRKNRSMLVPSLETSLECMPTFKAYVSFIFFAH